MPDQFDDQLDGQDIDPIQPPVRRAAPSAFSPSRGNREPVGSMVSGPGSFSTESADADYRGRQRETDRQVRVDAVNARADEVASNRSSAAALEDQMIQKGLDYYKGEDGALRPKRDEAGNVLYKEGDWVKAQQPDGSWAYQRRSKTGAPETKRATVTSKDATDPHLYYDFGDAGREVAGHVDDLSKSKDPEVALAATKHRSQWAAAQRKAAMKPLDDEALTLEQERAASEVQIGDLTAQQSGLSAKRAELEARAEELKAAGSWKTGWLAGGDLTSDAKVIQAQLDKIDADSAALSEQITEKGSAWAKSGDTVGAKAARLASVKAEKEAWEAEAKLSAYEDVAEERRAVLRKLGRSEKDDPILKEIGKVQEQFGARTAEARAAAEAMNPFRPTTVDPQSVYLVGSPDERRQMQKEQMAAQLAARPSLDVRAANVATQAGKMGDAELLGTVDYLTKEAAAAKLASDSYDGSNAKTKAALVEKAAESDAFLAKLKDERTKRGLGETNYELLHRQGLLNGTVGAIKATAAGMLQGVNQIGASAASATATVLDAAGFDEAAQAADSFSDAYREVGQEWGARNVSAGDLDSWWQIGAFMGNQSGQLAPQLAVGAGAARLAVGLASGAMKIGQVANAVRGLNVTARAGGKMAGAAVKTWETVGGASFAGLLASSATQEIGQIRQMQIENAKGKFAADTAAGKAEGTEEEYIAKYTNPYHTIGFGLLAGLGDAGAQSMVLKRFGIKMGDEGASSASAAFKLFDAAEGDKLIPRMMKAIAAYNVAELPTELAQTMIERLAVKTADPESTYFSADLWNDLRETGLAVAAGGILLGGLGGVRRAETAAERELRDRLQKNSATMFDAWVRGPENAQALAGAMSDASVRSLLPGQAVMAAANSFRAAPDDHRNAFALQIVADRVRATAEASKQIAAIPDYVMPVDPTAKKQPTPDEVSAVKNANRDAAAALVRIGNGIDPATLTTGQQAALEVIGAKLGVPMVDFVDGVPVVSDSARNWLLDAVPAGKAILISTEAEMREALAARAQEAEKAKPAAAAPVVPVAGAAAPVAPETDFRMKLTDADVSGPVAPARVLRSLGRPDSVSGGVNSSKAAIVVAKQTAQRVNRLLRVFKPVFGDAVISDGTASSGGFTVSGDGKLIVHLGDLAKQQNIQALVSDERLSALFTEEAAHVVSLKLEAEGKWNAGEAWAKLTRAEQALFGEAYLRDENGRPRAATEADSPRMLAHEMVRMFVQGRARFTQDGKVLIDGKTTEQVASRGMLDLLKDILSNIRDFLTGNAGAKGVQEMRAVADQIGGILESLVGVENFAYGDARNAPTAASTSRPVDSAEASPAPDNPSSETPTPSVAGNTSAPFVGEKIDGNWTAFAPESGSIGIPRAQMPQIKSESRGALTQFVLARGIAHTQEEVLPGSLKPTQAEFSPVKVAKAREFVGGDRAILVSADNHVVDGHHQWMAKLTDKPGESMRVIRLNASIRDLLAVIPAMPTAETAGGADGKSNRADIVLGAAKLTETGPRAAMQVVDGKLTNESRAALAAELGIAPEQFGDVESVTHKGRVFYTVNVAADAEAFPTSHNPDGTVRAGYPQDLQPRDRSGEVYLAQQRQMAASPDLGEEALKGTSDRGVPIVALVEGVPVVVMGNGRANAKALMYSSSALAPVAQKFAGDVASISVGKGIAPGVVGAIAKPTLYRVALDAMPVEALREASKESNEFAGAATNAVEQARQDAGRMTPTVLSFLVAGYDLAAGRNTPLRQEFVRSVIGSSAANITEGDLIRRIEAALFAKAFSGSAEGAGAFSRLLNEDDAGVRALIGAMMDVAPKVAAMNTAIEEGSLHPLRISDEVARAVEDIAVALRDKPSAMTTATAMDGLLSQQEMPGITERTPLQDAVLRFLVGNRGSKAKIASAIESYIQLARAEGDPKQMGMFGDVEVRTPEQLWQDAVTLSSDQVLASTAAAAAGQINRVMLASTPAGVRRPEVAKLRTSIAALEQMAREQASWRDWYARFDADLRSYFAEDAELFKRLLGATSQAAAVKSNVGLALKAYEQLKNGKPFVGYMPAVIGNLERIRADEEVRGPKISAYSSATSGGEDAVAVDRHIARLLFRTDKPSGAHIAKATRIIRMLAARLGWAPREVQASLWAANIYRQGQTPQSYDAYLKQLKASGALDERIARARGQGGRGAGAVGNGRVAAGEGGGDGILRSGPADVSFDFFGELNLTEPVKTYAASLPAEVKASKAAIIKQAAKDIPALQGNLFAATEIAKVAAPELFPAADEGQEAPDDETVDGQASPEGQQANLEEDASAPDEVAFAQERAAELENDPNAEEASVVADVDPLDQDEIRAHEAKFGPDDTLEPEKLFEKYRPAAERMAATRYSNIPGATKEELMQQARLLLWEAASGVSTQTQKAGNKKFADYGVGKNGTKRTFWQFAGNLLRRRMASMFTTNVKRVSRELSMDAGSVGIDSETGGGNFSADDGGDGGGGTIGDYMESGDDVAANIERGDEISEAQKLLNSAMAIMSDKDVRALRAFMAASAYGDTLKSVQAAIGANSIQAARFTLVNAQKRLKQILDGRGFQMSKVAKTRTALARMSLASTPAGLPPIPDWSDRALNPPKWKADANAWSAQVPDVVAFRSMLNKNEAFFTSKNPRVGEGPWRVTRILNPGSEQMRPMGHLSFPERELAFQYALAVGEPDMGLLFSMPADVKTPEGRDVWDAQLWALASTPSGELFSADDMEGVGDKVAYRPVSDTQRARLRNTLLFPFLGNKSALTDDIANVILAGANGATLVGDMMAGAGYYGNVLARLGNAGIPRIHNEWNGLRVAAFAAIKADPEGVIAANKKWADEFQRLDDETPANGRPENERMQEVVRKTDAAARAALEPLLPPNAADLAKTDPVPLPRTAEVAGLYLALQNITDLGKPLELEFGDDGKLKPLMTKKGTLANYRTGTSYAKLIREYSSQLAGTDVSQGDGYKVIGSSAAPGSFFFLDPGYTGDSSNYAKPLEGQTSREAFQRLLEGVAMDAWRKGAKLLITNNWDSETVLLLRRLGFTVLKEYRAGSKPELVAFNYDPQSGQLYALDGSTRSAVESRGAVAGESERDPGGVRGGEPAAVRGGERVAQQPAAQPVASRAEAAPREDAPRAIAGERAGGVGAGADRVAAPIGDQAEIDAAFAELMRGLPARLDEIRANQAFETDGTRVQGRPDLANPGGEDETARNAWNAADEARKPDVVVESRADAQAEAERMIATDRAGVLRALLAKARSGEAFGSTVENYASLILANELVQKGAAGDPVAMEQAAVLQNAHRESRSNVARILGAGVDIFKKPADRMRDFLAGSLFTPNPQARKKLEGVWKASEKAREVDRLKAEIATLQARRVGQPFTAPAKAEDSAQLLRLRKQLGEVMERSTREQEELKAIKERIKKVEKAMPGVTLDHIINSEAYFRLIGDSFSKNAVDAIGAGEVERRIVRRIRNGQDNAYISSGMGVDAAMVASVRAKYLAEVERRLRTIGDAALDPDNFDTGALKSGVADVLSDEERNRRIAIIMQRMGAISDDEAKVRTQKGVARKARATKERQRNGGADTAPSTQRVDVPPGNIDAKLDEARDGRARGAQAQAGEPSMPPGAEFPADAAGRPDSAGGDRQLVLGEDAEAMPPVFDISSPQEVAAISRAMQAADGNFFDMAYEAWINGILSGPLTQAANITGNAFNAGWELSAKRMGEAMVNMVVRAPDAPRMGEFKWMMKALQPAFARAWADAVVSFDTEVSNFTSETLDLQIPIHELDDKTGAVKVSIPGKTGRAVRLPGRLLMAADAFFKSAIAHIHVAAESYRAGMAQGLKAQALADFIEKESQSGSASWGKAALLARELTFQDDHKGTGMGTFLQNLTNLRETDFGGGIKPLRFIAPFIRTPFNIFQQGLRQSPAGAIMLAARLGSAGLYYLKDGKPIAKSYPTPQAIKHTVEQLMAWAFAVAIYGAAAGDDDDADKDVLITGSMSDKRSGVSQLNQRAGIGPYTLRVGGAQIKYGRIEPLATMLGTSIDMLTSLKGGNGAFDSFGNFMASAGAAADEKTFLRGWTDLSNAVQGETKLKGYVAQQVATVVPNLFKQPIRNLDPVVRQRGTGFVDTFAASIYSPAANPKIDVYGKEIEKPGVAAARLTIPAEVRAAPEVNRVDKLLLNWNAGLTPEERARDGWAPQPPARKFKVNGQAVELGNDAYEKYSRRTGELASRLLAGASLNVSKPTADDIRKVKTAFELARVQARREVVGAGAVDG